MLQGFCLLLLFLSVRTLFCWLWGTVRPFASALPFSTWQVGFLEEAGHTRRLAVCTVCLFVQQFWEGPHLAVIMVVIKICSPRFSFQRFAEHLWRNIWSPVCNRIAAHHSVALPLLALIAVTLHVTLIARKKKKWSCGRDTGQEEGAECLSPILGPTAGFLCSLRWHNLSVTSVTSVWVTTDTFTSATGEDLLRVRQTKPWLL